MHSVLDSAWLLRMLEKSAPQPKDRLLALFDILADRMEAPLLRAALAEDSRAGLAAGDSALAAYLTVQARLAGLREPEAIAQQFHSLALGAMQAELRAPGCAAFPEAGRAARILLLHQTRTRRTLGRSQALAAGMALALLPGVISLGNDSDRPMLQRVANALPAQPAAHTPQPARPPAVSPMQLASLNYSIERLRSGVCLYPQALMLPADQRGLFLDNVVAGGAAPSSVEHAAALRLLVQKVDCYYAPSAMTAS